MIAVRLIIGYRSFSNKNDRHHHHRPIAVAAGSVTSTAALWIVCAGNGRQQPQVENTLMHQPPLPYHRRLIISGPFCLV